MRWDASVSICIKVTISWYKYIDLYHERSNQNIWKYVKRSIFCKVAEFVLQLQYERVPSQVLPKDNDYKLRRFLPVCRGTTFRKNLTWLLPYVPFHKMKTAAQQAIACSRSTIQKLEKLWNVCKVYNKNTKVSSTDVVLVSLLLTLSR